MTHIFLFFAEAGFFASIIILLVLGIRQVGKNFLSRGIIYCFWFVVLIRLLVPIQVTSSVSVYNLFPEIKVFSMKETQSGDHLEFDDYIYQNDVDKENLSQIESENIVSDNESLVSSSVDISTSMTSVEGVGQESVENNSTSEQRVGQEIGINDNFEFTGEWVLDDLFEKVTVVWLSGIVILSIYFLILGYILKSKLKNARLLKEYSMDVAVVDEKLSPILIGVVKPKLLIGQEILKDETAFQHILQHEERHIWRHDPLIKLLFLLALILHWYNPIVWIGFRYFEKDMELSCDEHVMKSYNPMMRVDYAQVLLRLSGNHTAHSKFNYIGFGEKNISSRIKHVLQSTNPTRIGQVIGGGLVIALIVFFLSSRVPETEGVSSTDLANDGEGNIALNVENSIDSGTGEQSPGDLIELSSKVEIFSEPSQYILAVSYMDQSLDTIAERYGCNAYCQLTYDKDNNTDAYLFFDKSMNELKGYRINLTYGHEQMYLVSEDDVMEVVFAKEDDKVRYRANDLNYIVVIQGDYLIGFKEKMTWYVKELSTGQIYESQERLTDLEKVVQLLGRGYDTNSDEMIEILRYKEDHSFLTFHIRDKTFVREGMLYEEGGNYKIQHTIGNPDTDESTLFFKRTMNLNTEDYRFGLFYENDIDGPGKYMFEFSNYYSPSRLRNETRIIVPVYDERHFSEEATILTINDWKVQDVVAGEKLYRVKNPFDFINSIQKSFLVDEQYHVDIQVNIYMKDVYERMVEARKERENQEIIVGPNYSDVLEIEDKVYVNNIYIYNPYASDDDPFPDELEVKCIGIGEELRNVLIELDPKMVLDEGDVYEVR